MNKAICDCCNKEIHMTELFGGLMRIKKYFGLTETGATAEAGFNKETWDLCQDCQRQIWISAEQLKEHNADKK